MKTLKILQVITAITVVLCLACNRQGKLVNTSKEAFYLTMEGDTNNLRTLFREEYIGLFADKFRNEFCDAQRCLENYYFDEEPRNIRVFQDTTDPSLHVIDLRLRSKINPDEYTVFRYYFHGKQPLISSFYVLPDLVDGVHYKAPDSPENKGWRPVSLR